MFGVLPSEVKPDHTWRTRKDPFAEVWDEVRRKLGILAQRLQKVYSTGKIHPNGLSEAIF